MEKGDTDKKFEMLKQAIYSLNNKFIHVHKMFNDAADGIAPRMNEEETRILALADENKLLRRELDITKGLLAKQDLEISLLRNKVTKLTAKSMENNIIIGGLIEDPEENPKEIVSEFFSEKLLLDFPEEQIHTAHRIGYETNDETRPRFMIARLHPNLRDLVLTNKKKLKGKKNAKKRYYSVRKQISDEWSENSRELQTAIKKAQKTNDQKSDAEEKDKIDIKYRTLYINRVPQKKLLCVPKIVDIFPEKPEQDKIDRMKLYNSSPKTAETSTFIAHAIKTQSITEVRRGYVKIKQMYPQAAHVMAAFVIKNIEGNQDDREFGASTKILDSLKSSNVANLAMYVVRDYDGEHIGPRRHQLIQSAV